VNKYKNKVFISFREFYRNDDNKWLPTKKGMSISIEMWNVLKKYIGKIDQTIEKISK